MLLQHLKTFERTSITQRSLWGSVDSLDIIECGEIGTGSCSNSSTSNSGLWAPGLNTRTGINGGSNP